MLDVKQGSRETDQRGCGQQPSGKRDAGTGGVFAAMCVRAHFLGLRHMTHSQGVRFRRYRRSARDFFSSDGIFLPPEEIS
jgi:hypothetical protein